MRDIKIKNIIQKNASRIKNRKVCVELNNGTKITIEPLYEGFEQYGGTIDEMKLTLPIAEQYNDWLHGIE